MLEFVNTLCLHGTKIDTCGFSGTLCNAKNKIILEGKFPTVIVFNCHSVTFDGQFEDTWEKLGKFQVNAALLWNGIDNLWLKEKHGIENEPWNGLSDLLQQNLNNGLPNGGFPVYIVFAQCHGNNQKF